MDDLRKDFETEAEAIAFVEGLQAMHDLLDADGGQIPFQHDMFVDNDKWIVGYSFAE